MSKFFLTNSKELINSISAEIDNSLFKKNFEYSSANLFAITTTKLDIKNTNHYSENDDFVFATGTLIYQGSLNLKKLFLQKNLSIEEIRDNALGHYCICLKDNITIKLFGPAYATYDIYYYHMNGVFLVSNDLYTISNILSDKITVNKFNVIEECIHTILGNETVYNEIKRLDGNEYLQINDNKFFIKDLPYNKSLANEKSPDIAKKMSSFLATSATQIYNNLGNPSICMTAGLDARMSLATYLSIKAQPDLYYGVGNSFLTNTQQKDLEIDSLFEKKYNLKLNVKQWITPKQIDHDWPEVIKNYGFYAYIYGGSNEIFDFFRKTKGQIITFGYGGELYRNLDWIENKKNKFFSIEDFINFYYVTGDLLRMTKNVVGFKEHLYKKLSWICQKYDLNPQKIPNEANIFFLQEYRKTADTHLLNFINLSKYCSLLLMESECIKYGMQSTESLKKSKFMLSVINQLKPEILEIPVFSHRELKKYNPQKGILERKMQKIIKDFIKSIIPSQIKSLRAKKHIAKNCNVIKKQLSQIISEVNLIDKDFAISEMQDYRDSVKSLIFHKIIGSRNAN